MIYGFVGDIQERPTLVPAILAQEHLDHIVFLGDVLDSMQYPPNVHIQALDQILDAVEAGRATLLYGNHELSYLVDHLRCSGWNAATSRQLCDPVRLARWEHCAQAALWLPDAALLATHAGVTRSLWERHCQSTARLAEELETACADLRSWFYNIGACRGGRSPVGGPLWCDWITEFEPVTAIRQIVGHTHRQGTPQGFSPETMVQGLRYSPNGDVCVDCLSDTSTTIGVWDDAYPTLFVEPYTVPVPKTIDR